eukprot:TRINITY_DN14436_c0_g1_i1.p1 TRINITY_DN14436_c0_g1~~TRINITY_DN14436_c0_g1_i1.p1  ORF type:complete len:471 (+),score=211.66 TRINITY_DN14436_c0_g1_i1:86-1414(+)
MDDPQLDTLLQHSMASPQKKGMLDCSGLGYKRGTSASTRTIENAFKNYLQHKQETCVLPNDFLRGTGRKRKMPKRAAPLPQLHVLADTTPAELNKTLYQQCPAGLNVVFYEAKGYVHPSREFNFRRVHPPNTLLDLDGVAPLPVKGAHLAGRVRPATSGARSVTPSQVMALRQQRRERRRNEEALASQVQTFEARHGLIDPAAAASRPGSPMLGAATPPVGEVDSDDGFLVPPTQHRQDPCPEGSQVARLIHAAQRLKKTCLRQLVNRMSVTEAKAVFTSSHTNREEFIATVGRLFEQRRDGDAAELGRVFDVLLTIPFRRDTMVMGKMQKESWILLAHFLWRALRGDREALLKLVHLYLEMRERDLPTVHKAEVQMMLAAYRGKKRHSIRLLHAMEAALVHDPTWQHDRMSWTHWSAAVNGSELLFDAFIGKADTTIRMAS